MRKLFVSFTALLIEMAGGRVTKDHLVDGLFSFGCVRKHALCPWEDKTNEVEWIAERVGDQRAKEIHSEVLEALLAAEKDGRTSYRTLNEQTSYEKLNRLLMANGYPELPRRMEELHDGGAYSYPGIANRVKALGLELEVIH